MVRRNSLARIFNSNAVDAIAFMAYGDNADISIEFDGILDQVSQHLDKPVWIREDFDLGVDKILDGDSPSAGGR